MKLLAMFVVFGYCVLLVVALLAVLLVIVSDAIGRWVNKAWKFIRTYIGKLND